MKPELKGNVWDASLFMKLCLPKVGLGLAFFAVSILLVQLGPGPAFAGQNSDVRLALHVKPHSGKASCGTSGVTSCSDIVTSAPAGGTDYDIYVIATNAVELKGYQFGISYPDSETNGVKVWSWNNCGGMEIPSAGFPGPGSGNAVAMDSCRSPSDGLVVLGRFFVTAYGNGGRFSLIHDPRTGRAEVGDCSALVDSVIDLGFVDFGVDSGYNPCTTLGSQNLSLEPAYALEGQGTVHRGLFWSPDGSKLAIVRNGGIYVHQVGKAERPSLVCTGPAQELSWSPDGTQIAAVMKYYPHDGSPKRSEIKLIDLKRGNQTTVAETEEGYESLSWSKSEKILVREGDPHRTPRRAVFQKDGGRVGQLSSEAPALVVWLKGKPLPERGNNLSREELDSIKGESSEILIWISGPDGSQARQLTTSGIWLRAQLSPLGNRILADGSFDVHSCCDGYVLDLNGNIVVDLGNDFYPTDWSPDGHYVLGNMSKDDGHNIVASELVAIEVGTGKRIRLTNTPDGIELEAKWSPDGMRLAWLDHDTQKIIIGNLKRKN